MVLICWSVVVVMVGAVVVAPIVIEGWRAVVERAGAGPVWPVGPSAPSTKVMVNSEFAVGVTATWAYPPREK